MNSIYFRDGLGKELIQKNDVFTCNITVKVNIRRQLKNEIKNGFLSLKCEIIMYYIF